MMMDLAAVSSSIFGEELAYANLSVTDGFFDAGMLLQALKASQEEKVRPNERAIAKRAVGKKLRLSEY